VSAILTTIAESQSALLHGYTLIATDTAVPDACVASPACTRQPRRALRVGPRYGADQHAGHRGVGGVVGANAAGRRIGVLSDDMPQIIQCPRRCVSEVDRPDEPSHGTAN
jgi:hypothetical protein